MLRREKMKNFHTYTSEQTEKALNTDISYGLSEREAKERLVKNGRNEILEEKKKGFISKLIGQLNDFLIIVLILAAVVSFIVGILEGGHDLTEPVIILLIVVLNAGIGIFQEGRAEKSLLMLKKMSAPEARVLREGKEVKIPAFEIVSGDILLFEAGDIIAADARLTEGVNVMADESLITGEAEAVNKNADMIFSEDTPSCERKNMLFSSTSIVSGHGRAIVTDTGMNTEVGRVAGLILNSDTPETPLQKRMSDFGKKIGIIALIICVIVFFVGVISGYSGLLMFITSVSLAVAAIPEGLPAIVTIMLALGVMNMAKHKAIVRNLPSVETLGSAGVICTDKTGTITENKMKVMDIFTYDEEKLASLSPLCCAENTHNPTELAILKYCENNKRNMSAFKKLDEIPFSSRVKKMTVLYKSGLNNIVISKGAADILLNECTKIWDGKSEQNLTFSKKHELLKKLDIMADDGLRVIAVAYKSIKEDKITENNMAFLGLFGISDPPRKEAEPAVEECRRAGIIPVMITGDHLKTAVWVAKKTGIFEEGKKAVTGHELDKMTDDELEKNISDYRVFARVSPEHKARIVKAWQKTGKVVAMTGDGVNDAPALKSADIGCSLGISGTDVAKAASDMILTDDNFATVVEAVRHGRLIFKNIKKTVRFLLSSNTGEIITILLGVLMRFGPPLTAIQLLWVNLVTDSLPAIALGVDPETEDLMSEKPSDESFFSKGMMVDVLLEGVLIGVLSIIAFCIGAFWFSDIITARTMAFCTLSISQLIHSFNMRSEESILKHGIFENKLLLFSAVLGIGLQILITSVLPVANIFKVAPLSLWGWGIVFSLAVIPVLVMELQKYFNLCRKKYKKVKKI